MDPHIAANRATWDERAPIHVRNTTGFYGVDAFKAGGCTLHAIERDEVGPVAGKRLLHLQCHFGLDTLSWARRGAKVTGLDFSEPAIAAARDLARETGIDAAFVVSDVHAARAAVSGDFDIVFTSWGVLCWLPDMTRWAKVATSCLAPGGMLYVADGHCALMQCERDGDRLVQTYDWRTPVDRPENFDDATTYTGDPTPLKSGKTFEWFHPPATVAQAMIDAGLTIELIREHDTLPWPAFPMMVDAGGGMYRLPDAHPKLPLSFSIRARRR